VCPPNTDITHRCHENVTEAGPRAGAKPWPSAAPDRRPIDIRSSISSLSYRRLRFSAVDHPARDLAVPALHVELSGREGSPGRAWGWAFPKKRFGLSRKFGPLLAKNPPGGDSGTVQALGPVVEYISILVHRAKMVRLTAIASWTRQSEVCPVQQHCNGAVVLST
jgi:hypothetical protein